MTAWEIIEEIKRLPRDEQAKVLEFAQDIIDSRRLTPEELGAFAKRVVETQDPAEADRLEQKLVRGFYGAESLPELR